MSDVKEHTRKIRTVDTFTVSGLLFLSSLFLWLVVRMNVIAYYRHSLIPDFESFSERSLEQTTQYEIITPIVDSLLRTRTSIVKHIETATLQAIPLSKRALVVFHVGEA